MKLIFTSTGKIAQRLDLPVIGIKQFAILKVILPYSFHRIRSPDNLIPFDENGSACVATLTPGNYTVVTEIENEVKRALEAASTLSGAGLIYTVDINVNTGFMTIETTQPFTLEWSNAVILADILGYDSVDLIATLTGGVYRAVGTEVVNLIDPYVFLRSKQIRTMAKSSLVLDGIESDAIAMIPINTDVYSTIEFSGLGTQESYIQINSSRMIELDFYFTDEYNREITSFNGKRWLIECVFSTDSERGIID